MNFLLSRERARPRACASEHALMTSCAALGGSPVQRASPQPSPTLKPRKSTGWHSARGRAFLRTLIGLGGWCWHSHHEGWGRGRKRAGEEMTTEKWVRIRSGELVLNAKGPF